MYYAMYGMYGRGKVDAEYEHIKQEVEYTE